MYIFIFLSCALTVITKLISKSARQIARDFIFNAPSIDVESMTRSNKYHSTASITRMDSRARKYSTSSSGIGRRSVRRARAVDSQIGKHAKCLLLQDWPVLI